MSRKQPTPPPAKNTRDGRVPDRSVKPDKPTEPPNVPSPGVEDFITEGTVKKGGQNPPPTTSRPDAPKGQDIRLKKIVEEQVEKYGPSILEEAQSLVHGPRQAAYDHPYDNHKRIAGFMSVYLADILKRDITPREAAMCILLVKIAREMFKSKRDNGVDICGYSAVIEMIDAREEEIHGESSGSWHRS